MEIGDELVKIASGIQMKLCKLVELDVNSVATDLSIEIFAGHDITTNNE